MVVLLDTNIILEHLRSGILVDVDPTASFVISVITEAELLRYPGIGEEEIKIIERFLSITPSISIDSKIARHAAMLGRSRKTKLPDLLIAATAIKLGIPLITLNLKDFQHIPNLDVRSKV